MKANHSSVPTVAQRVADDDSDFTLLEFCQPIFDKVATDNETWRDAKRAAKVVPVEVRAEWTTVFALLEKHTNERAQQLRRHFCVVKPALVHFVDEFIVGHRLEGFQDWAAYPLAVELVKVEKRDERDSGGVGGNAASGTLEGGEHFFSLVEAALKSPEDSKGVRQYLLVYYACIGLGFRGVYLSDPAGLTKVVERIQGRIKHLIHRDVADPLYANAHSPIIQPRRPSLGRWVTLVFLGCAIICLCMLIGCNMMYKDQYRDLETLLNGIENEAPK